jgi:hypothetical protein
MKEIIVRKLSKKLSSKWPKTKFYCNLTKIILTASFSQLIAVWLNIVLQHKFKFMAEQGNTTNNDSLQSFVARLNKSHYDMIFTLCGTASEQAQRIQQEEALQTASQYVALCNKLIAEVQHYINIKKTHLVPYINSLFEKEADGHDCRSCTGTSSCSMQHDLQLAELTQSHLHLNDIIVRLQMVVLPLYSGIVHHEFYQVLQKQMALLENSLAELLSLERTYLIPTVVETQLKINARV